MHEALREGPSCRLVRHRGRGHRGRPRREERRAGKPGGTGGAARRRPHHRGQPDAHLDHRAAAGSQQGPGVAADPAAARQPGAAAAAEVGPPKGTLTF